MIWFIFFYLVSGVLSLYCVLNKYNQIVLSDLLVFLAGPVFGLIILLDKVNDPILYKRKK